MLDVQPSDRLKRLPPYLFAELERKQRALRDAGKDVINISIGDPDQPPPEFAIKELVRRLHDEGIHMYSTTQGEDAFREAIATWFKKRYNTDIHPFKESCLCVGSKEVIAHLPLALTNPGDVVLIPEPGYPPYRSGAIFALCEPYVMPLRQENGFLPDLDDIPADVARRAKILYVNYPNNPTGATATRQFYQRCIEFANKYGCLVVSDEAYAELYYEEAPISFLSVPGAKDVGIVVHSMTKTFNMAGWRVAWVAGHAGAVDIIRGFKANCDSGQFKALQHAAAAVLRHADDDMRRIREMYKERRDVFVGGLRELGWNVPMPGATFYVWFEVPKKGMKSMEFVDLLLEKANIVLTPGIGFGRYGEGFVRVALTQTTARLREAVDRIRRSV